MVQHELGMCQLHSDHSDDDQDARGASLRTVCIRQELVKDAWLLGQCVLSEWHHDELLHADTAVELHLQLVPLYL